MQNGLFGCDSVSLADAAWEAAGPFSFTLDAAGTVTFAVDDYGTFGDDSGGVSLSYRFLYGPPTSVPEPGSLLLALPFLLGVIAARRRPRVGR